MTNNQKMLSLVPTCYMGTKCILEAVVRTARFSRCLKKYCYPFGAHGAPYSANIYLIAMTQRKLAMNAFN